MSTQTGHRPNLFPDADIAPRLFAALHAMSFDGVGITRAAYGPKESEARCQRQERGSGDGRFGCSWEGRLHPLFPPLKQTLIMGQISWRSPIMTPPARPNSTAARDIASVFHP
jgi:hypothetical protein